MTRTLPFALIALFCAPSGAHAAADDGKPGASAPALLEAIGAAKSGEERLARARELASLDPTPIEELREFLARDRTSTDAGRREVLAAIDAEVPNEKGQFKSEGRRLTPEEKKAQDERDWLAELAEVDRDLPAMTEVFADVAAIHALAKSKTPEAATVILDFAFTEVGLVYRDDCGRQLRDMSPFSLPALIRGAEDRRHAYPLRRYAQYQLERLDRENPHKAMRDAITDDLKVAVLQAFAESRYRVAIYSVLEYVDHVSPKVRKAAREAWISYAKRRPYKVPKRKLELTGGKLTEEEEPLWMDHKELQVIAIRRKLEELTGEAPPRKASLIEMSDQLFAYYDGERTKRLEEKFESALAKAEGGELEQAAEMMDEVLVQAPKFHRKDEMVPVYLDYGESLEAKEEWEEAALAYGKAHAMAPKGPKAKKALGKHHYARGKVLEAEGSDASAEFARALEVDPEHDRLSTGGGGSAWMLFAGLSGGAGGLVLLALGLILRRRQQ